MYQETQYGRGLLGFLAATDVVATASSTAAQVAAAQEAQIAAAKTATSAATSTATAAKTAAPSATTTEAATEAAALAAVCPSGVGKGTCTAGFSNSDFTTFIMSAISTRYLPPYQSSWGFTGVNCTGYTTSLPTGETIATIGKVGASTAGAVTGGLTATGAIAAGSTLAVAVPVIGAVIGLITGIIGIISAHHAQAVATQNELLCQLVPGANQALQTLDAGLAGGSITPAQASSALSQLQSQLASGLQSDPSYKHGDALWIYNLAMTAICNARNTDLTNGLLTGGAPGPWTQAGGSTTAAASGTVESSVDSIVDSLTSSSTLPWVIAGAAALLFLL
jgi:hypothetical protein